MQTYKEKVAILASVDSLGEVEVHHPEWPKERAWQVVAAEIISFFRDEFSIRVRTKTITRTITAPKPVTLEWAQLNPNKSVYVVPSHGDHFAKHLGNNLYLCGLVFKTKEDAKAAEIAFKESMK